MTKKDKKELSKEELMKILEVISKAYEEAGRKINTATLINPDDTAEVLIDNREDEDKPGASQYLN